MAMPKHSISYEVIFHDMLNLLGNTHAQTEYLFEQASPTQANYFRLRFYAFQRTVYAENLKKLDKALAAKDNLQIQTAQQKIHLVEQSKSFQILLRGSSVIASKRDLKFPEASQQVANYLEDLRKTEQDTRGLMKELKTQVKENADSAFMEILNKPQAQQTQNPTAYEDPYVEATRDIQPTKHTLQWQIDQSLLLLKLGKSPSFTRDITEHQEQQDFMHQLTLQAYAAEAPPFSVSCDSKGVTITRV